MKLEPHKTLEESIQAGYVIRDRNHYDVANKYWHWCTENTKPFVAIIPRIKYASVEMDLLNTSLRGLSREAGEELINAVRAFRCKPRSGSTITAGGIFTWMPSVLIEDVEKVARLFYDIALEKGNLITQKEMKNNMRIE